MVLQYCQEQLVGEEMSNNLKNAPVAPVYTLDLGLVPVDIHLIILHGEN